MYDFQFAPSNCPACREALFPEGSLLRILVVDDDASIRSLLESLLVEEGFEVELAGSAQEALSKIRSTSYHLVLTDLTMPDLNGWELAEIIHREVPLTKVAVLTGLGEGTLPPSSVVVDCVIGKPINFTHLFGTLQNLLG